LGKKTGSVHVTNANTNSKTKKKNIYQLQGKTREKEQRRRKGVRMRKFKLFFLTLERFFIFYYFFPQYLI